MRVICALEARTECAEFGVHSQSGQNEVGESGNLHLSRGEETSISYCMCVATVHVDLQRLKHQTPRQVDLNFEELIDKFKERQRLYEESVAREKQLQAEK